MAPGHAADGHKKEMNKGVWTAEEDRMLSEYIEVHGAKKWKTVAAKSGLNRCGKSCRLRWLNYLRPNIKRGNISQEEEDLILRLHKLLGNRWSLIAGRLPGRTDNEIKNYWNSHLCKKMGKKDRTRRSSDMSEERSMTVPKSQETVQTSSETDVETTGNLHMAFADDAIDDAFDFSIEGPWELGWIDRFLELGDESWPKDI